MPAHLTPTIACGTDLTYSRPATRPGLPIADAQINLIGAAASLADLGCAAVHIGG
jgi:hypothetical protein